MRIHDSRLGDLCACGGELYRLFESMDWGAFVVGQNLKARRLWHRADAFTRVFIFEAKGDEIGECFAARAKIRPMKREMQL